MDDLYTPAPDLDDAGVAGEINFVEALIMSLDPQDQDSYAQHEAHYSAILQDLHSRLSNYLPAASTSSTPGGSVSTPESSGSSRKRVRDPVTSGFSTQMPVRSANPFGNSYGNQYSNPNLSTVLLGANYEDLTQEALPAYDPFAELSNAYTSNQPAADAFNQEWMDTDQLVRFLVTPTPVSGGYSYNSQGLASSAQAGPAYPPLTLPQIRTPTLEEELFGSDRWGMPAENPEAVRDLIDNIKFNQEVQPEAREQTPISMASTLMEHQKIALTWLLKMERSSSKGGILADEMGLGKTVQALALILANPSTDPACKTTLIVAPVALMRQWEKEISRHVKSHHQLKVHVYHGGGSKAAFAKLRQYDVVLTTYGTLGSELKRKEDRNKQENAREDSNGPVKRRSATQTLSILGRECKWFRVILDEAQCIKNRNTWASRAANDLISTHRWCLTGTPMQNNVDELFSLVRFLKIPPYNVWGKFSYEISRPLRSKGDIPQKRAMDRVQVILKSIMLRRCKTTRVDGKQICDIPPKRTHMQSVEFSDAEHDLYKAIETRSQVQFNKYLARGTVNNHYANMLVMLLRLRQICCHPHLVKDLGVQASTEGIDAVDLKKRAEDLTDDVVKRLKETDGFECPICYEIERNPTIFMPCGHTCCGDCFQKLIDPSRSIREGNETAGAAKCPHCRSILSTDRITDFKHFCLVHCPEKLVQLDLGLTDEAEEESDDSESSDDEDERDDVDKEGNLAGFVVDSDEEEDADDSRFVFVDDEMTDEAHGQRKSRSKGKGKGKGKGKAKANLTLAQLKKKSLGNKSAKRKYLKRLRRNFESSAKIDKTMELLSDIKAEDSTEKTLIFSQFTSLLDLLEVPLQERKIKYQRYDGSMSMNDRADAVTTFMDDPSENVFLISLKAGNAGLNLNTASQVIMLDPFWNPFVEEQAVDRAHRMPQKREVHVHRLLVPETVEDRICLLQDKKRDLINTALDEGVSKSLTRLSVGELQYLFGLRERPS